MEHVYEKRVKSLQGNKCRVKYSREPKDSRFESESDTSFWLIKQVFLNGLLISSERYSRANIATAELKKELIAYHKR